MAALRTLDPAPPISEADREKARRFVASQARDADEARDLLSMLGLLGPEFGECPGRATWYRKNVCRCANCKKAWAARERTPADPSTWYQGEPKVHGSYSTYRNYRCRCDPCKAAATVARKERRARKVSQA